MQPVEIILEILKPSVKGRIWGALFLYLMPSGWFVEVWTKVLSTVKVALIPRLICFGNLILSPCVDRMTLT